ncbi:GNAT family N-acetyltransferase [Cellulomonas endophytica]|uniref:GNAT family N-acetyltransferase n=1 Tax=Cellulomonas endophytica TaxID=2494735 RepID=UPI001011E01A|nr:GNAT family N-acetyltransferase [Cellulomonas endophytica]
MVATDTSTAAAPGTGTPSQDVPTVRPHALPEGYRTVPVPAERVEEYLAVDALAFAMATTPELQAQLPFTVPVDRAMGVEGPDGGLAAVHGSYAFRMPVPGGDVACAGLTWVGVRPDHRRRGLLRSMIATHVERSLERGEPVSALWAAEPAIYGRFGYGSAADSVTWDLTRGARLRDVPGSADLRVHLRRADGAHDGELVERLHRAGAHRPGWMTRDSDVLRQRVFVDPVEWRHGAEALLLLTVATADGEPRGYALFARTEKWEPTGPAASVRVKEVGALDAAAAHRVWSFLLDLDLTATVRTPSLALDDPLAALLVDPRGRGTLSDNLWVRLLDLPTALAARRWSAPVDVVLEVTDALLPANAGRWRLATGEGAADGTRPAVLERTDAEAAVRLDVRELGAAYLGGRSFTALAAAGLVRGDAAALRALDLAAGWPVAPLCSWVF